MCRKLKIAFYIDVPITHRGRMTKSAILNENCFSNVSINISKEHRIFVRMFFIFALFSQKERVVVEVPVPVLSPRLH